MILIPLTNRMRHLAVFLITLLFDGFWQLVEGRIWDGDCGVAGPRRIRTYSRNPAIPPDVGHLLPQLPRPSVGDMLPEDIALANPWFVSVRGRRPDGRYYQIGAAALIRVHPDRNSSDIAITSGFKCDAITYSQGRHYAVFGAHDKLKDGLLIVPIETCYPNNEKNHHSDFGDIGIIKLSEPVDFTELIRPICMPESTEANAVGTVAIVPAWGYIGHPSHTLRLVQLQIVERDQCTYSLSDPTSPDVFCVGAYGRRPELGYRDQDCGGPVMKQELRDGTWKTVMIGVAILNNRRLAEPGLPTLVSSVAYHVTNEWMERMIRRVSAFWPRSG